jgi:predicted RNA-binding protein with PIN domain
MGRTVLVDGYNVIRRDPALARLEHVSLERARDTLLSCINSSPQFRRDDVTVVFDGANSLEAGVTGSRSFRRGRIRVMFSPPGESADAVLQRLAAGAPRGTLVVTDDREIRDSVSRAGVSSTNLTPRATPRPAAPSRPRPAGTWVKEDDLLPDRAPPKKGNGRRAPRKRNRGEDKLHW